MAYPVLPGSRGTLIMPNPNTAKRSLDGARARVSRASEHIARLEAEAAALDWTLLIPAWLTGTFSESSKLPPIIAILIGETVYNLRAALDYLVYELAILDSGKAASRSQFPLESCEDGWNQHEKNWLDGISDGHKARIKDLQPFKGVIWTATLREVSNPDKHRHLTVGRHGPSVRVTTNWSTKDQTIGPTIDKPMQLKSEVAYVISFDDSTLVMATLKMLQREVCDVIEAFDPDFK